MRAAFRACLLSIFLLSLARVCMGQTWNVRGVPGLTEESLLAMAYSAKPSWHTVPAGGAMLDDVLRSVCGMQEPRVDASLKALTLKLNGGSILHRQIPEGVAVSLPFCLKIDRKVSVIVQKGDTLEGLLREHYGLAGPKTQSQTFEINNANARWRNLSDFSKNLPVGQTIVLPYASQEMMYTPRKYQSTGVPAFHVPSLDFGFEDASRTPDEIVRRTASPVAAATFAMNTRLVEKVEVRGAHEFDYVRFMTAPEATKNGCIEPPTRPVFDIALLKGRFKIEADAASKHMDDLRPVIVGIIDSGISGVDKGVFSKYFFAANPSERSGKPGVDDDLPENGYIDDIYGMNFNKGAENGSVEFYSHDPNADHGTKVAALVLGGKEWIDSWDSNIPPWARLKIVNFSSSKEPNPVDAENLGSGIDYLMSNDARVINMSLSNRQAIESLRQVMNVTKSRTLFVVAAGNTSSGGKDIALVNEYPAMYGGQNTGVAAVLTVGAHNNSDGKRAGFSNFSNRFVDLLAPGCAVPTLDIKGIVVSESGTSLATALTSFAASLVGALGETQPRNLKNRLLVSVDVDSTLEFDAWSSGRLNIIKAISLSNDVIEFASGSQLHFGRLTKRDELRQFCSDPEKRLQLGGIRKVRPNIAGKADLRIQYWVEHNGLLSIIDCVQGDSNQSIGDILVDSKHVSGPRLSEVRDIVLADRP